MLEGLKNILGLGPKTPSGEPLPKPASKTKGPVLPQPQASADADSSTRLGDKRVDNLRGKEPLNLREELVKFINDQQGTPFKQNEVRIFNCGDKSILFLNALSTIPYQQAATPIAGMSDKDKQKIIEEQTENILEAFKTDKRSISIPLHSKAIIGSQNFADATIRVFTRPENLELFRAPPRWVQDENFVQPFIYLEGDEDALLAWEVAIETLPKNIKDQAKEFLKVTPKPMEIHKTTAPLIVCPIRGDGNQLALENLEKSGPTAKAILKAFASKDPLASEGAASAASASSDSASAVAAATFPPVPDSPSLPPSLVSGGAGHLPTSSSSSSASAPVSSRLTPEKVSNLTPEQSQAALSLARKKIASVPQLKPKFALESLYGKQIDSHEAAKTFLCEVMPGLGGTASFVSPGSPRPKIALADVNIDPNKPLDPDIFRFEWTGGPKTGVQANIIKAGQTDDGIVRIFVAASQFNGAEASGPFTHTINTCIRGYLSDPTQGPQAQMAYSADQIRAIAAAANFPYNGLCHVLDEETIKIAGDGYFRPTLSTEKAIIQQLQTKGHLMEFPLIGNTPRQQFANTVTDFDDASRGSQQVYMMLTAAPAIGYLHERLSDAGSKEIQFLTALNRCRAEFKAAIDLATKTNKPVELKMADVGCGVFGNDPAIVAKALYQAALECQQQLKDNRVTVQVQSFGEPGTRLIPLVTELGLKPRSQAGSSNAAAARP